MTEVYHKIGRPCSLYIRDTGVNVGCGTDPSSSTFKFQEWDANAYFEEHTTVAIPYFCTFYNNFIFASQLDESYCRVEHGAVVRSGP